MCNRSPLLIPPCGGCRRLLSDWDGACGRRSRAAAFINLQTLMKRQTSLFGRIKMAKHGFKSYTRMMAVAALCFLVACSGKKLAPVAQPAVPPPAPPAPTATLSASPDVLQQGQSSVLSWQTSNATDINIDGLGTVPASGSRTVTPGASRTYTLTAQGAGGRKEISARITVNPATQSAAPIPNQGDLFAKNVKDVYFNFDDARIRSDETPVTQNDAQFLSQHPDDKVLIEGHCDDRGSELYNLALGTKRAESAKEALIQQGIDSSRIKTISYGKEKPFCEQENEQCWQENRRDHFVLQH
jgi:peptidoglycan-associated lipoprotein